MADITPLPAPRVPIIDQRTGLMSREWYRFFLNLANLVGSGKNEISISDLLIQPPDLTESDIQTVIEDSIRLIPPVSSTEVYPDPVLTIVYDQAEQLKDLSDKVDSLPIVELGQFVKNGGIGSVYLKGTLTIAPSSSVTPVNNGDVSFEFTSNTSLTIKAKGSDGTVRSGTITLA